jgi:molybdopterin-binding protein
MVSSAITSVVGVGCRRRSSRLSPCTTLAREENPTKLSARNKPKGTTHVKIDIVGGTAVTASITKGAAKELKLAAGQNAYVVIKASDTVGVD